MDHPIDKAVKESGLGSIAALAKKLGVTRAAVDQWRGEGRRVPAVHCPEIEKLSKGIVRCEQLNSDVDWTYLRNSQPDKDKNHDNATSVA